jgi:hypothetical protein
VRQAGIVLPASQSAPSHATRSAIAAQLKRWTIRIELTPDGSKPITCDIGTITRPTADLSPEQIELTLEEGQQGQRLHACVNRTCTSHRRICSIQYERCSVETAKVRQNRHASYEELSHVLLRDRAIF